MTEHYFQPSALTLNCQFLTLPAYFALSIPPTPSTFALSLLLLPINFALSLFPLSTNFALSKFLPSHPLCTFTLPLPIHLALLLLIPSFLIHLLCTLTFLPPQSFCNPTLPRPPQPMTQFHTFHPSPIAFHSHFLPSTPTLHSHFFHSPLTLPCHFSSLPTDFTLSLFFSPQSLCIVNFHPSPLTLLLLFVPPHSLCTLTFHPSMLTLHPHFPPPHSLCTLIFHSSLTFNSHFSLSPVTLQLHFSSISTHFSQSLFVPPFTLIPPLFFPLCSYFDLSLPLA